MRREQKGLIILLYFDYTPLPLIAQGMKSLLLLKEHCSVRWDDQITVGIQIDRRLEAIFSALLFTNTTLRTHLPLSNTSSATEMTEEVRSRRNI